MSDPLLIVRRFLCSGEYEENCYVAFPRDNPAGESFVIDPGGGLDEPLAFIRSQQLRPAAIICTHGHLDHILGVPELLAAWPGAPTMIGRAEGQAFDSPDVNLSAMFGLPVRLGVQPTRLLDDGDELTLGGLIFKVLTAPGHSPGSICLHCPASGDLFTGDVLFDHGIGRSDLPDGSERQLLRNIREKLMTLPGQTRIWPGHGPDATLETCGFDE
jgi:hydroxyacylglutathione hydrolase